MDSKARTPLILAFAVVLVFVVSLTGTGAYLLLSGIEKIEEVVVENTRKGDLISDMRVAARLRALSVSQMLLIDDPFDREEEYDLVNAYGTDFIVARNALKEMRLTTKEQLIFDEEIRLASEIGGVQQEIVDLLFEEQFAEAIRLQVKVSIPIQRRTDELLKQLQGLQRKGTSRAVVDAVEGFQGSLYILLTMALFILVAILIVARIVVVRAINSEKAIKARQIELEHMVQIRTAELVFSKEQAEKASQTKTDFLSRMSHELRTPLNAILGFSQILQFDRDKTLTSEQLKNAAEIQTAGTHLLALINELLDLSQIESGNLELQIETLHLSKIVDETVKMLEPLAEKRAITVTNNVAESMPKILGDKLRLKQVFLNIIANAIKYNYEKGAVYIDASVQENNVVRLLIKDTGQGISEESKEKVFNNFERLSSHGGIEGSGIGLSVSRHLIELMNGEIGVESTIDSGCTFWIEFPIEDGV